MEDIKNIVLLQPTCPLRDEHQILKSIELMENKNASGIISVSKSTEYPQHMNILPENLDMSKFINDDFISTRTQDLPIYYKINGAIYISNVTSFKSQKSFFLKNKLYAFKMSKKLSIDIDDLNDFNYASFLYKENLI